MDELEKIIQGRMAMRQSPDSREAVRAFDVQSVDIKNRTVEGIASSEIIDRDHEIVSLDALKEAWTLYKTNPAILAAHMHRSADGTPTLIGSVVDHRFIGKRLWIKVLFAKTSLAEDYWQLYRDGFQRAFSIGFNPLEAKDEIIDGKRVPKFTKIDLFEISCVAVGANPEALTKSRQRKQDFVNQKKSERLPEGWDDDDEECYKLLVAEGHQVTREKLHQCCTEFAEEILKSEYDVVEDEIITDEMLEEAERKFWGPDYKIKREEFKERLEWLFPDDEEDDPGETKSVEIPDYVALFNKKKSC